MLTPASNSAGISRATFGGLTLLLVVAMACQLGGVGLPEVGGGNGTCRIVQEMPVLAQAQVVRRAARQEKQVPAWAGLEAQRGERIADELVGVEGAGSLDGLRAPLELQIDLPPPSACT